MLQEHFRSTQLKLGERGRGLRALGVVAMAAGWGAHASRGSKDTLPKTSKSRGPLDHCFPNFPAPTGTGDPDLVGHGGPKNLHF